MPAMVSVTRRAAVAGSMPWRAPAVAIASTTSATKAGPQLMIAIAGSICSSGSGTTAPARPKSLSTSSSGPSAASAPGA